jgi:hypothetical protein
VGAKGARLSDGILLAVSKITWMGRDWKYLLIVLWMLFNAFSLHITAKSAAGRDIMIGFVAGAIAGGALVWFWGDRIRQLAQDKTQQARDTVARGLENVQAAAEGALDSAKEQVLTGLQAGQDFVRPGDKKPPSTYR